MKDYTLNLIVAAALSLVGLVLLAIAIYRLENRVWSLEVENVQMRGAIHKLKNPLPKVQTNPLTGRPHRLIEYSEPEATR